MYFATFYQRSAIDPATLIEACGDRAVIILDGRESAASHRAIAAAECAKRGYLAWQLHKGDAFTRSAPTSPVNLL
jgi:hypothetical protein